MKNTILSISILFGLNALAQTIPTSTVTGSLKINDSLNVTNNINAAGDITATGEVIAQDTLRAQTDIIVEGNAKILGDLDVRGSSIFGGSLFAKQGFTFDGIHGMNYTPASGINGAIYELGTKRTIAHLSVFNCPNPSIPGTTMALTDFVGVYRASSVNGLVNATTEMYNTPWNGYGHIEVQGTDQLGGTNNELLINFWCGRNTQINTGPNGGKVILGKTIIGSQQLNAGPHTDAALTVDGKMVAKSCYITINDWADYVFASDYKLLSLKQVEAYYKENKHLPEVPSEKDVIENGVNIAEMNKLLLKKVEELTLYLVQQQKDIELLKSKVK